jgi:hypothetical protein
VTDEIDTAALAEIIAPRLVAQYGPNLTGTDIAQEIEGDGALERHPELAGLTDGDLELLYDDIKDLAPGYTVTVQHRDVAVVVVPEV